MVCHETYKDKENNWLSPVEVEKININISRKEPSEEVKVGPSELCRNLRKM